MTGIVHWEEVPSVRREAGHIGGLWADLGIAAGTLRIGLRRITIDPGRWSTPAHVHGAEEEIFVVLAGSGVSWQDGRAHEVAAGDALVHRAMGEAHTLRAGPDGLDVLAFGERVLETATHLPRAGASWLRPSWVLAGGAENHPFTREAAVGEPEVGDLAPRPGSIVALAKLEPADGGRGGSAYTIRDVGRAAGSVRTGLRRFDIAPGKLGPPPHTHSAEEELFVVLEGAGTVLLGPEEHALRPGTIVSRPPATRVAHAFQAGTAGLGLLAYSNREPNDIVYYPRSGKVFLRGVGVMGRIEQLDYWDGEE